MVVWSGRVAGSGEGSPVATAHQTPRTFVQASEGTVHCIAVE